MTDDEERATGLVLPTLETNDFYEPSAAVRLVD
jgi:hypothetical protein